MQETQDSLPSLPPVFLIPPPNYCANLPLPEPLSLPTGAGHSENSSGDANQPPGSCPNPGFVNHVGPTPAPTRGCTHHLPGTVGAPSLWPASSGSPSALRCHSQWWQNRERTSLSNKQVWGPRAMRCVLVGLRHT